jgi:enamine deaminase RidA (YjgF/YER057c/UK114 family)
VFTSIYNPGKLALLVSWTDAEAAGRWTPTGPTRTEAVRHRAVRVVRDYGMFDRREAPQFNPAVPARHARARATGSTGTHPSPGDDRAESKGDRHDQRSHPRRTLSTYLERWKAPTSAVTRHGDTVYVSGLPPFDAEIVDAPVERQAEIVIEQMKLCLETAGSSLADVLKCNVYCTSVEKFAAVNQIYARPAFSIQYPSGST